MDNPQHYQPLSHALHPPSSALSRGQNTHYASATQHASYEAPKQPTPKHAEAEEEDEEEDDDDEGLVEEQLNQNDVDMHGSDNASPQPSTSADVNASTHAPHPSQTDSPAPEPKRRPGRPRGSKNRRPRVGSAKHESSQFYYPPSATEATASGPATAPQHANINPQNQHYYEFQWRVLNLCAEFYGAAEELVKGTPSLVIAQCYSMGPGVKVDPLVMIAEAKRVCDALLSNPSQLITNPPPPTYPVISAIYHPMSQPNANPAVATSAPPTTISSGTPNIITNPQTFVVPLGVQPPFPAYPIYSAAPGQYPTTPYYQYAAYGQPGVHYAAQPQSNPPPPPSTVTSVAQTSTPPVSTQPTATITTTPATGGTVIGNQGAWSEEETEQLKRMAEESRSKGTSGEIDWDWLIQEWGISRTRHQILIKATALGLKESSSRGTKRRRDADETTIVPPPMASLQQPSNSTQIIASPAQSTTQTTSTPAASPAMPNQQRPSSSKGPGTLSSSAPALPWPMPTVAVNTTSPVLTGNTHEAQRSSYYRPRPNQDSPTKSNTQPTAQHSYYTPTGQVPSGLRPAENGK